MRLDHLLSRDICCFVLHDEVAIPRSKLVGCAPQGVQTPSAHTKTEECWRGLVSEPEGWLVSTVQLSGTPDSYFYNCIAENITITSILPRQEEREKQRKRASVCAWMSERVWSGGVGRAREAEEEREEGRRRSGSRSEPGEHKRERVRGGCLGAEGRRRTRRPAKRSGGAACERRALRIRMGQPVQSDVWTPPAEYHRQGGGQWAN